MCHWVLTLKPLEKRSVYSCLHDSSNLSIIEKKCVIIIDIIIILIFDYKVQSAGCIIWQEIGNNT